MLNLLVYESFIGNKKVECLCVKGERGGGGIALIT